MGSLVVLLESVGLSESSHVTVSKGSGVELSLRSVKNAPDVFVKVMQANLSQIVAVDLSFNELGDEDLSKVACGLETNNSLTSIDLSWNRIVGGGVAAIAQCITNGTCSVKLLNLKNNQLSDDGAIFISRAFPSLTSLNLSSNLISGPGIEAIANALADTACSLTSLDLSFNSPTSNGVNHLAQHLSAALSLRSLTFSGPLPGSTNKTIFNAVQQSTSLCSVDLWAHGVDTDLVLAANNTLSQNQRRQQQQEEEKRRLQRIVKRPLCQPPQPPSPPLPERVTHLDSLLGGPQPKLRSGRGSRFFFAKKASVEEEKKDFYQKIGGEPGRSQIAPVLRRSSNSTGESNRPLL